MDTAILKQSLISKIQVLDNLDVLQKVEFVLNSSEKPFELSEAQIQSIEAGKQDVLAGRFVSHNKVMEDMKLWLKNQ